MSGGRRVVPRVMPVPGKGRVFCWMSHGRPRAHWRDVVPSLRWKDGNEGMTGNAKDALNKPFGFPLLRERVRVRALCVRVGV